MQSVAVLIGYGAAAVNPYVMLATVRDLVRARRRRGAGDRGGQQGAAEDDLEDGHLDAVVVLRRAGVRGGRALGRARRAALHRHAVADRRDRSRRARRRSARTSRARVPRARRRAAAGGRAVRVAARRRASPVEPRDDRAAAARRARRRPADVRAVRRDGECRLRAPLDAARVASVPRAGAGPARRGRARRRDRQALLDRRDVARLAVARGARDARAGDEPASAGARTPARAARIPRASATTGARRSSRSRRAASA